MLQGVLAALGVLAAGLEVDWALGVTGATLVGVVVVAATGGFLGRADRLTRSAAPGLRLTQLRLGLPRPLDPFRS